jgi:hypothetical protein
MLLGALGTLSESHVHPSSGTEHRAGAPNLFENHLADTLGFVNSLQVLNNRSQVSRKQMTEACSYKLSL